MKRMLVSISFAAGLFTLNAQQEDVFTDDRDGHLYKIIQLGDQVWMTQNMAFKCPGSYCYNDKENNSRKYGRLYTWEAATNVCPDGWKLPSDKDWKKMERFMGMDSSEVNNSFWRGSDEGYKLKAQQGWNEMGNGSDIVGFSFLPGGYRSITGNYGLSADYGYCWTSTELSENLAWYRRFCGNRNQILRFTNNKLQGYSVRCIQKDESE